jgi:hypothetical protein
MDFEQPVGDVNAKIRVHSDQISVNRRVMQPVNGKPFERYRLAKLLVRICLGGSLGPSKRWVVVVCQPMTNKVGMSILWIS